MAVKVSAAARRQIFSVLDETARSVQHLHLPALRKLTPVLRQAHEEIEASLRHWLSRENGEAMFTTQRYRNAVVSIRHALATIHRMAPQIEDALWTGADVAGHLSTSNIIRELQRFSQIFEGTIHPVSIDTAAIIANGDKVLWRQFESSAQRYAGSIGDGLIQELAVSRAKSETIFEATNRLQKKMPQVFASDRWGAERLTRTECLTPDTLVSAGVVSAAFRRWYQGPIVEIVTDNGRKFSTTPNHPMLAVRGWLGAQQVAQGDYLVCHLRHECSGAPGNEDVAGRPASIGQVFDALSAVGIRERRTGRQPDFHGDGQQGDVEIASADRHLRIGNFAPLYKPLADNVFAPPDGTALAYCDRCGRLLSMQRQVCLCSVAHGDAHFDESLGDRGWSDSKGTSYRQRRFPGLVSPPDLVAGYVRSPGPGFPSLRVPESLALGSTARDTGGGYGLTDPRGAISESRGHFPGAEARDIEIDRVKSVRLRNDFAGHVYNLSTPFGYFNISGAYTGNTLNAYNQYHVQGLKQLNEEDPEILSRWDASFDWRRCRMCGSLDGQVRDVANGEKFVAEWFSKSRRGGMKQHRLMIAAPPGHPCCFVPGTPVLTPGGWRPIESLGPGDSVIAHDGRPRPVTRRFESRFVGTICKISSGKQVVYATPNHPMAAQERWVRADSLDVQRDQLWVLESVPAVTHDNPAGSAKDLLLRSVVGGLSGHLVPAASVDLDRHQHGLYGDVDVEFSERFLRDTQKPSLFQGGEHGRLIATFGAALLGLDSLLDFTVGLLSSAGSSVGGGSLGLDLCPAHSGVPPGVVLPDASQNTGSLQDERDRRAATSVSRGQGNRGLPTDVESDDFILRERNQLWHALTLRCIDSSPRKHTGIVHNLEIENAGTYIAGGFLVHNCRCVVTPWRSTWANVARAEAAIPAPPMDYPAKIAARARQ